MSEWSDRTATLSPLFNQPRLNRPRSGDAGCANMMACETIVARESSAAVAF